MKQKDLVSIIVPVYQAETYLERGIISILAQTYRPIEILLIEDGATDKSGEICDAYAKRYSEISVFHREHKGVSAARNYGILQAKGKYIQFVDADDEMMPEMIEKLVHTIQSKGSYMAVCGYEVVGATTSGKEEFGGRQCWNGCCDMHHAYEIIQSDLLSVTWNKLYIRDRILNLYEESMMICEDSVFCTRYFMQNPKVAVCPQVLYRYYLHDTGLQKHRIYRYKDIKKYFYLNCKLVQCISEKEKRKKARYHAARVFFYGVYTYIFERLPLSDINRKEKRSILHDILHDDIYIHTVSKLRRMYFKENCYRLASVLQSEGILYVMIWCRNKLINKGK